MTRRREKPATQHAVGGLLKALLGKQGLMRGFKRAKAVNAWAEVVGPALARNTRAVAMRDDVLMVETKDAIAATTLTMGRGVFLEKLREVLGADAPRDVRFQFGQWETQDDAVPPRPLQLGPSERRKLEQKSAAFVAALPEDSPSNLRDVVQKAAQAVLSVTLERERRGEQACLVCGLPVANTNPCLSCRTLLQDARVREAAMRLVRTPDVALRGLEALFGGATEHELNCAKHLALAYLESKMNELALELVKATGRSNRQSEEREALKQYLVLTTHAFLGLSLFKWQEELRPEDQQHLPERVRQVLQSRVWKAD